MKLHFKSYLFVIIQFSAIFYLLYSGGVFTDYLNFFVCIPGGILAFWSLWIMQKSVISVFPDPDPNIRLITSGPYKFIRHPMYTSLFLFLIPLVIIEYSTIRFIVLLIFAVNQILKLVFEEKLLTEKLPDYKIYMTRSWRLIPLIY